MWRRLTTTVALIHLLQNGDADILALELPSDMIVKHALVAAGVTSADGSKSWAIRDKAPVLAEALRSWQMANPEPQIRQKEEVRFAERRQVRRKARAVYLSRERGVISVYDDYFREAAVTTGWDWRLIAAVLSGISFRSFCTFMGWCLRAYATYAGYGPRIRSFC